MQEYFPVRSYSLPVMFFLPILASIMSAQNCLCVQTEDGVLWSRSTIIEPAVREQYCDWEWLVCWLDKLLLVLHWTHYVLLLDK